MAIVPGSKIILQVNIECYLFLSYQFGMGDIFYRRCIYYSVQLLQWKIPATTYVQWKNPLAVYYDVCSLIAQGHQATIPC